MKKLSIKDQIQDFTILVDSREQTPWKFDNSIIKGLPSGDYSIQWHGMDMNNRIVIERKSSVSELFSASGTDRDRWERELERLKDVEYKWVICEFPFLDFVNNTPPGKMLPSVVYGSICSWMIKYKIPFIFCENRINARSVAYKLLQFFVKYEIIEREINENSSI